MTRIMRRSMLVGGCLSAALTVSAAEAHHSVSAFDLSKTISYTGTVAKIEWQNPHCWFWVDTTLPDGSTREVGIETASPLALRSVGMKWDTVKEGDKVTILAAPARNGHFGGLLSEVKWADGRDLVLPFVAQLRRAGGPAGPPPP